MLNINPRKVVIAMSGGVDSSVAAALLLEQGYDVIGIMLRLWSEPGAEKDNRCCTPDSMALARRVAARLKIPFYVIDAQEQFYQQVVLYFIHGYANNSTPNPCIACNRSIRWDFLFKHALALGADALATGHYVRTRLDHKDQIHLLRGIDPTKDQSYVLHILNQQHLQHALFPLGDLFKSQVRDLARSYNLPVAERPDSQDLCFLGGSDYRSFLERHAPQAMKPGPIVDIDDRIIGQHNGLANFTIGQRKGLNISSPSPLYVLRKKNTTNVLVVGPQEALGSSELTTRTMSWVSGTIPVKPFRAQVKIRYKSKDEWALVTPLPDKRISVSFDIPLRDITPGQAAVVYDGEICLGGGEIEPPQYEQSR